MIIRGFPPVYRPDAKILILGSMPGEESLRQNQYYAHPRNLFWKLLSSALDLDTPLSYEARLQMITDHKLALWDVCESCVRPGSLDSSMREVVPNDIPGMLNQLPDISRIVFNGQKAHQLFRRYFQNAGNTGLYVVPSSSPANAGITMEVKMEMWRQAIVGL